MQSRKKQRMTLFLAAFQLSACTFGGGFVIIPLMRRKFVQELGWIGEQEMLDLTAIAQSSPGAIAVNASILVGYRVAGPAGALLSVLGTVLPPLIILSVISLFYAVFRDNRFVSMAMTGMLAGVGAVICDVVLHMGWSVVRLRQPLPLLVMAGAFAAVYWFGVNLILVILVCGVVGGLDAWRREQSRRELG